MLIPQFLLLDIFALGVGIVSNVKKDSVVGDYFKGLAYGYIETNKIDR